MEHWILTVTLARRSASVDERADAVEEYTYSPANQIPVKLPSTGSLT